MPTPTLKLSSSDNIGHMAIIPGSERVERLATGNEASVLNFLSARPAHTAYMAGLVYTNGLESQANRGDFHAYYNRDNTLEGVALVGHAVTFEARSVNATQALARHARRHTNTALIRCERDKLEQFWQAYATVGRGAHLTCQEQLLELTTRSAACDSDYELRRASPDELEEVISMNVELALDERGNDPLKADPEGFRQRVLRRIRRGQVWILTLQGKVVFKAEIITRTPEVVYLEGIYVRNEERGKGHGVRSMRQLGHILLKEASALCVFVNQSNHAAQALYRKAGYQAVGHYDTIYLLR